MEISTDPERLDLDRVHGWLSELSYWARGRPREVTERAFANSLPFGAYAEDGTQIACARVVTDRATFGYLADVFVAPEARGRGVGKALVAAIMEHPDLAGIRRLMLAADDAHGLYERHGFRTLDDERHKWLGIRRTMPWQIGAAPHED